MPYTVRVGKRGPVRPSSQVGRGWGTRVYVWYRYAWIIHHVPFRGAVLLYELPLETAWTEPQWNPTEWKEYEVKRPEIIGGEGAESVPHATPGKALEKFPNLSAALLHSRWDDGEAKNPGILVIRPFGGTWKATLKIDGTGMVMRAESQEYNGLLPALEALLGAETPPWEPDPYAKPIGKKKR